ncbi:MAG TPA: hypothetical protein VMU94_05290, partial [Streptosporangiaceae bacterium]|nr:hypothetical protein [Streptosporangiaceae bacterium]
MAGGFDGPGVDVRSVHLLPAHAERFVQDGARSAAWVEQAAPWWPGETDHGCGYCGPQCIVPFLGSAVVLAHPGVGCAEACQDLAWLVFDDPEFELGRIIEVPSGLLFSYCGRDLPAQLCALE